MKTRLSGAKVIDGKARTLLPGLIDGHTHAFFPDHLKQAAIFGVTTELDMFTDHGFDCGKPPTLPQ